MFMFLIVLLAGCAEKTEIVATNKVYDILRRGDQYSIRLKENTGYWMGYESNDLPNWIEPMPKYKDLASMKQDILNGNFSQVEFFRYTNTYRGAKIDSKEALICDPYELYHPYVPAGMTINDEVGWCVSSYYFRFTGDKVKGGSGGVDILIEKQYSSLVSEFNDGFVEIKESAQKENATVQIVEETVDPDTGEHRIIYTRTYMNGETSTFKETRQKYETPQKSLYIRRTYHDYDGNEDAAPYKIDIYSAEDGGYFHFYLYGLRENPNVQWLSQFGIKPFEGDEPPPKAIG